MRTVSKSRPPKPPKPEPDPYRYGWRYVPVKAPNGTETFDQVPLTLEDVLFPEVGDFIVQTDGHIGDVVYLRTVFKSQLARDRTAAVTSDCRVDWNLPRVRPLGPDVAVFFGVRRHRNWATFNVADEGARPALVVEVTSPDTRKNDLGPKVKYYHRAKVPFYLIADVSERDERRHVELIGYRYEARGYQKVEPDARGWIYLEAVGLWVGVTDDPATGFERLACYDPVTGQELGDYTALKQAQLRSEAQRGKRSVRRARLERLARAEARARATSRGSRRSRGPGPRRSRDPRRSRGPRPR